MAARDTYNSTVATAEVTKAASIASAETVKQEAINASGCNTGFHQGVSTGSSASYEAAVKAANAAKLAAVTNAEIARQASLAAARDTLRNAGTDAGAF